MTRESWRIVCVYYRIHYVHFYFGVACHFHLAITRFFVFVLSFVCLCLLNIVVQTLLCHLVSCGTSESLMSPVKQAPQKSPSDTEGLVNSVPARSHQGPVIYAQLDHSGGQHSDKINKSESVVYADIRKN